MEILRGIETFSATPFNLMRVLREALGADFAQARELMALYDAGLNPLADPAEIDEAGGVLLAHYREQGTTPR